MPFVNEANSLPLLVLTLLRDNLVFANAAMAIPIAQRQQRDEVPCLCSLDGIIKTVIFINITLLTPHSLSTLSLLSSTYKTNFNNVRYYSFRRKP